MAAELEVKTKSGDSVRRSRAERKVAFASCNPSGHCHNQTGSRWALPLMCSVAPSRMRGRVLLYDGPGPGSEGWHGRGYGTCIGRWARRVQSPFHAKDKVCKNAQTLAFSCRV